MTSAPELSIFLFPFMVPPHTNPMMYLAKLLAKRGGTKVTVLTTPSNAPLLRPLIDILVNSIDLLLLRSECHDNSTSLRNSQMTPQLFTSLELLCQHPLDQFLTAHRPDCLVFDSFLPWAADAAVHHNIPSLVFHAVGFFNLCIADSFTRHKPVIISDGRSNTVLVPGIPHRVEMKVSQLSPSVWTRTPFSEFADRMVEAELKSCGAVVNSWYEMEPDYADHYRKTMGRSAWHVGPLCLDSRSRGPTNEKVSGWLDSKPPNSIVYVCFGSLSRLTATQLQEIGIGLASSDHPFIWVARDDDGSGEMVREEGKGFVVSGWAEQMAILSHEAVGGFVTHCGWNSVTEAVSAGVPMVTWPLFGDQFYNERLVVEVLGVGVSVGVEVWGLREEEKPVVAGEKLRRAVVRAMECGGGRRSSR